MRQQDMLRKMMDQSSEVDLNSAQYKWVLHHLNMAYGVGFNEGRKSAPTRRVDQYLEGCYVRTFCSVEEAARALSVGKSAIIRAINKEHALQGFRFSYIDEDGEE